jgi:hypothetical protein
MKILLMITVAGLLSTGCKKNSGPSAISIGDYTGPNILTGIGRIGDTAYHCTVDPAKVKATGEWIFGSGEPPLGPDKAMRIAGDTLKEKFPEIKDYSSDVISLIRFKEGSVYQTIFSSSPERKIGDNGDMRNHMYIYVYMDGSVEVPTPAPPGN